MSGKALEFDRQFDEWWELYPRKVAKGAARVEWLRALRKVSQERLLEALRAQVAAGVFAVDATYIPHARKWLHDERWDDELVTKRAASAADGLAERWRDACRRADDRTKAALKQEAARRGIPWEKVREALERMNGGAL